jgi:serine-type D-Ala-D-Ala carboxypeptidase/endopeptidase (penicillin-binding protein 4)
MKTYGRLHGAPRVFAAACIVLLAATARPFKAGDTAQTTTSLRDTVTSIVTSVGPRIGIAGICVIDGRSGDTLLDINADKPMKPASNNKLRTTAAALTLLGPDFRFKTDLMTTGTVRNGVLEGDLIVRGGADPSISGRFEKNKKDVTRLMREWADELIKRGIREVNGAILVDPWYLDGDYFLSSWYPGERAEWYEAEIWGLSFNDGCVDITWSGRAKLPGDPAQMTVNPPTSYARVINAVKVAAVGRPSERSYGRAELANDISATGTITVDTEKEDSAAVHNGPLYFASVFNDVLSSAGVRIAKPARMLDEKEAVAALARARLVKRNLSPPLSDIIAVINRVSQNFYADSLVKALGREKKGEGSYAAGVGAVMDFYRAAKIPTEGMKMVDGSGLSALNEVTPRQLVLTIRHMDNGPRRTAWRDSFPIGGVRGSLKSRFQQTTNSKALAPRIMGKTGLIGGVRSLSGIARNGAGRDLYYSIILNDFRLSGSRAIELIDSIAVAVAASSDAPVPAKAATRSARRRPVAVR